MTHRPLSSQPVQKSRAFSLTELLFVITVISILLALTIPAASSFKNSRRLAFAGNSVVDLARVARENAVTRNISTGLVLVTRTGSGSDDDNRLFCVIESADNTWKMASGWGYGVARLQR